LRDLLEALELALEQGRHWPDPVPAMLAQVRTGVTGQLDVTLDRLVRPGQVAPPAETLSAPDHEGDGAEPLRRLPLVPSVPGSVSMKRLLVGALLTYCLAQPLAAQEREEITVAALTFVSSAPLFIAKERGYYDEEGLDVTFEFFRAAQPVAVAIASGDADFG